MLSDAGDFSQPLSDVVGCSSQLQASAAPDVVGCASQLEASGAPTPLSSQVLESAVRMSAVYHGFPGKLVDAVVDQPVIHSKFVLPKVDAISGGLRSNI